MNPATRDQIVALHTLYAQWERHSIQESANPRAARLAWASSSLGREIASFTEISRDDARWLIDALKGSLGQASTEKPQPWRRVRSRAKAHAAGTAGRRDTQSSLVHMASHDDLARIDEMVRRLGWTADRYEAWRNSKFCPVSSRDQAAILTVDHANRIYWALKAMLRRSGGWYPLKGKRTARSDSSPASGAAQVNA